MMQTACVSLGIKEEKNRRFEQVMARAAVIVILRRDFAGGVQQIGRLFNVDHTTVIHHCDKHPHRVLNDVRYAELYTYIRLSMVDEMFDPTIRTQPIIENIKLLCELSFSERTRSGTLV